MARVTGTDVRAIIATSLDDAALLPFITPANQLVDELLLDKGLGEPRLKEIERWLAAHFVALREPRDTLRGVAESRHQYETPAVGQFLNGTRYGQMAIMLDTSGTLAALAAISATKSARIEMP
jgi:hypothetical protein